LDEAYVDLTPYCQGKNADESLNNAKPIADRIKSAILQKRKLHCKIGIASSMMVAKIASDLKSPDGINVVHDADLATLLPPLGVNEIPGVGDANERKLKAAGYNTIADIQREPAGFDFTPIVGNSLGSILRDFAYGKDRRPVVPDEPNKSFGREDTFEFDTNDIKKIMPVIIGFAKELEARLRAFNRVAWLVKITYAYEFNKKKSQQKTLGAPVSDFGLITANGASILTGGDILSRPLYLVGISVGSLSAPGEMPPTKKKLVQRHRDEMVLFDVKGLK
jgi:DNA polymerase-4